jgi:murein tripeptide amidase MpaA
MPRYYVKITGRDYQAMADLVLKYKVHVARHTVEKLARGYRVNAQADGRQLRALEAAGYKIKRIEDVDKEGKKRQREVRQAAKKTVGPIIPPGIIPRYYTVGEVEDVMAGLAKPPHDTFTSLIKLPNLTWEQRTCHALKIGKGTGSSRPGIYFLGGVHAREWGSPDILIHFIGQLIYAYATNTAVTIGTNTFTAAQIKSIVETKDVYVFPQCNPDGRNYSMTTDANWRKNRRPAPPGHNQPSCVGVDINRNYDFLWNYPLYYDASAPVQNSTNPCDYQTYIGPSAVSEPETKNAVWMFDKYPNIRYFIDIHSYSEDILYSWGDDDDQSNNSSMNFQNAAYNGKRGIAGDAKYREYIPLSDKNTAVNLANKMKTAIQNTRGRVYKVEQSMDLYPTAGTSDDYAFGRHFGNAQKAKVYSYTIEWGSPTNPTPFHPPYIEMKKIIQEITAALFAFCIAAT